MATTILSSKYFGWEALNKSNQRLNIRSAPGLSGSIVKKVNDGKSFGTIVGLWHQKVDGHSWYVVLPNFPFDKKYVFVASGYFLVKKKPLPNEKDAERTINKMLNNDKQIVVNISNSMTLLTGLYAQHKIDHQTYRYYASKIVSLLTDVMEHQQLLNQYHPYLTVKKSIDTGIDKIKSWLGLDALPLIAVIGIGVGIGAAITIILYYLFKPRYDESRVNLKISESLSKALRQLPEKDQERIKQDLEHQIDKAYNQGKTDEAFSNIWSVGKYLAVGGLAIYLFDKFVNHHHQ